MKHAATYFFNAFSYSGRIGLTAVFMLSSGIATAATYDDATTTDDLLGQRDLFEQLVPDTGKSRLPGVFSDEAARLEEILLEDVRQNPKNPFPLKQLALFYVNAGRLADATAALEKALALQPGNADLALDVARLIAVSQNSVAARKALQEFAENAEDPFPFELAQIQLGYEAGAKTEARGKLAALIRDTDLAPQRLTAVRLLLARYLVTDGLGDQATDLVDAVIADQPANANARAFRAYFRLNRLDLDGARSDIDAGLAAQPDHVPLLRLSARANWRGGNRDAAVAALQAAADASGNQPDVILDLASALEELGQRQQALERVKQASLQHRNAPELLAKLGAMQLEAEDWESAETTAVRLRRFSTPAAIGDSEKLRIGVLQGRGQSQAALDMLRELGAAGGDVAAVAAVVNDHLSRDEVSQAQTYIDGLITGSGPQPALVLMRGSLNEMQGNADAAETDYRAVVRSLPQSATGHIALARHLLRRDDPAGAEAAIRTGLGTLPDAPTLKLPLVEILVRRGAHEAAIEKMEELVRAYPDNPVVANNYVSLVTEYMATDADRLARAVSVSGQLASSPVPQLRDTYAWLLHIQGDNTAALGVLETVLAETPDDAWANFHAGMVHKALGNTEKALVHLKMALDSTDSNFDKSATVVNEIKLLTGG